MLSKADEREDALDHITDFRYNEIWGSWSQISKELEAPLMPHPIRRV